MRNLFITILRVAWIRAILLGVYSPLRSWLLDTPCEEIGCSVCDMPLGAAYPWEITGKEQTRCSRCKDICRFFASGTCGLDPKVGEVTSDYCAKCTRHYVLRYSPEMDMYKIFKVAEDFGVFHSDVAYGTQEEMKTRLKEIRNNSFWGDEEYPGYGN